MISQLYWYFVYFLSPVDEIHGCWLPTMIKYYVLGFTMNAVGCFSWVLYDVQPTLLHLAVDFCLIGIHLVLISHGTQIRWCVSCVELSHQTGVLMRLHGKDMPGQHLHVSMWCHRKVTSSYNKQWNNMEDILSVKKKIKLKWVHWYTYCTNKYPVHHWYSQLLYNKIMVLCHYSSDMSLWHCVASWSCSYSCYKSKLFQNVTTRMLRPRMDSNAVQDAIKFGVKRETVKTVVSNRIKVMTEVMYI